MNRIIHVSIPAQKKIKSTDYRYVLRGSDIEKLIKSYELNRESYQISGIEIIEMADIAKLERLLAAIPEEMPIRLWPQKEWKYTEIIETLSHRKTLILLDSNGKGFENGAYRWLASGFNVEIALEKPGRNNLAKLKKLLDYYLYTPSLSTHIQPFRFLLENIIHKSGKTLFDYHYSLYSNLVYIQNNATVTSGLLDESETLSRYLPVSSEDFLKKWQKSRSRFMKTIAEPKSPCLECQYFSICGGYFYLSFRRRTCEWTELFKKIVKEIGILSAQFERTREKQSASRKEAMLFVSNECRNNCVFCAVADRRETLEDDYYDRVEQGLNNLLKNEIDALSLSGHGEPTLNPRLAGIIEKAKNNGVKKIVIFTNGFGMTAEKMMQLLKSGATGFLLSLHGIGESHDLAVGRSGSFKDVMKFLSLWRKYHTPQSILTMNTCLTRFSANQINEIIQFSRKNEVSIHTIAFPEISGNAIRNKKHLIKYQEIPDLLAKIDDDWCETIYFENIPDCLFPPEVSLKILRKQGTMLYEDSKGIREISQDGSVSHNIKLDVCLKHQCAHYSECCGFDKRYIEQEGTKELAQLIDDLLKNQKIDYATSS